MRFSPKLAVLATLVATSAFAGSGKHYWDEGHRTYTPYRDQNLCKLRLIEIYQPEGGSQPIHVKVQNASSTRLRYTLSMRVGNVDAGTFNIDNANAGEISDRDASKRFPGTLTDSRISIAVTSCSIPS